MIELAFFVIGHIVMVAGIGLLLRDRRLHNLLMVYTVVLVIGGALVINAGDSWHFAGAPNLGGSDGETYFLQAGLLAEQGIFDFRNLIKLNYYGYQIYLALWFSLFGVYLGVGLAANNLLLLLSAVALYRATDLLTDSRRAAYLACLVFMLTTVNIFNSLVLLKDTAIGLSFALILLTLAEVHKDSSRRLWPTVYFFVALLIIITMRSPLIIFLGVLLFFVGNIILRRSGLILAIFILLLFLMAPLAQYFTVHEVSDENFLSRLTRNDVILSKLGEGEVSDSGIVGRISGAYLTLPFVVKLMLFPIPTGLQIYLPFDFWSTKFLTENFAFFFSRNLNVLWFLFVAVWAFFALWNFRHIDKLLLRRLLLSGVAFYTLIAVIYGGAVPRYAVPALFFIYPAIGYWWDRSIGEVVLHRKVRRFFKGYYAVFGALAGLYILFQSRNLF